MKTLPPSLTVLSSPITQPTTKMIVTMKMLYHFGAAAWVVEGHTGLLACHAEKIEPLPLPQKPPTLRLSLSPSSITQPQKRLS